MKPKILILIIKIPFIMVGNFFLRRVLLSLVLLRSLIRVLRVSLLSWMVQVNHERFSWMNEKGMRIKETTRRKLLKIDLASSELILTNDYLGRGIDPFNSESKFELMSILNDLRAKKLRNWSYKEDLNILGPEWVAAIGHISHSILFPKIFKKKESILNFYSKAANSEYLKLLDPFITYIKLPEDLKEVLNLYFFGAKNSMNAVRISNSQANKVRELGFDLQGCDATLHEALTIGECFQREQYGTAPFFGCPYYNEEKNSRLIELIRKSGAEFFVTLHVRDSVTSFTRGANNADIRDYVSSIEWLTNQGILVIRLGDAAMSKFNLDIGQKNLFFDYAHSDFKSAQNDMFLLSNCKFLIGTSSGPGFVPNDFGIPVLLTNSPMIGLTPLIRGYFIPHLFKERETGKVLTLREMYETEVGWKNPLEFKKYIRLKNSPTDILEGVKRILNECNSLMVCIENRIERFEEIRKPFNLSSSMAIEPTFLMNYSNSIL